MFGYVHTRTDIILRIRLTLKLTMTVTVTVTVTEKQDTNSVLYVCKEVVARICNYVTLSAIELTDTNDVAF